MSEERRTRAAEAAPEPKIPEPKEHESTYAVEEAIAGGVGFDSTPEEVAAALHAANLTGEVTASQVKAALKYVRTTPLAKLGQKEE